VNLCYRTESIWNY